jgi:hypothetical protein
MSEEPPRRPWSWPAKPIVAKEEPSIRSVSLKPKKEQTQPEEPSMAVKEWQAIQWQSMNRTPFEVIQRDIHEWVVDYKNRLQIP